MGFSVGMAYIEVTLGHCRLTLDAVAEKATRGFAERVAAGKNGPMYRSNGYVDVGEFGNMWILTVLHTDSSSLAWLTNEVLSIALYDPPDARHLIPRRNRNATVAGNTIIHLIERGKSAINMVGSDL